MSNGAVAHYGAKFREALLAFYDFRAERWVHLRTTNPIVIDLRGGMQPEQDHQRPGTRAAGIARQRSATAKNSA